MSKKITHEQAREGLLQVYIYNDIHTNEANYVLVRDYITQQEKLEKLLNQIKDIINRPYDISSMLEESKRYVEIENLIKELENEIR